MAATPARTGLLLICAAIALVLATSGASAFAGPASRAGVDRGPAPRAAQPRRHAKRCGARSRTTSGAATRRGATWGWGWHFGGLFADAVSGTAKRGRKRCPARKHSSGQGVSSSGPLPGPSAGSSPPGGAPGVGGPSGVTGAPGTAGPSGGAPSESGEGPAPPSSTHVQVTAVEYHFTLSRTTVPAGKVTFDFVNAGQDEHNLNVLSGEGSLSGSFPDTAPKGVRDQTIEMRAGSYTLFCSLPEHEAKGMKVTLVVE
jgi:plastocyanin